MGKPKILVFASGSKDGGGSGFEKLVENSRTGNLEAEITAVVSNHPVGGVRAKANKLEIPFVYFSKPWSEERYLAIAKVIPHDYIALSGWLKLVLGLDPKTTINIHPGKLPEFGGPGKFGHHVHEEVLMAYKAGKITHSAVSMHFVTPEYDKGPVFFHLPVEILPNDTADDIATRVNLAEHRWQSIITNLVVHNEIYWDGKKPESLRVPKDYLFLPPKK